MKSGLRTTLGLIFKYSPYWGWGAEGAGYPPHEHRAHVSLSRQGDLPGLRPWKGTTGRSVPKIIALGLSFQILDEFVIIEDILRQLLWNQACYSGEMQSIRNKFETSSIIWTWRFNMSAPFKENFVFFILLKNDICCEYSYIMLEFK